MNKKTVFVGLSGGVDSAVSAALLKQATPNNFSKIFGRPTPEGFSGFEVVGVFIKTWHPDFLICNEEQERHDAMRVAAFLDIPFLTFDFEDVYKKFVGDYMISEYKKGRTPNPDVMCNKYVKFGAFLDKAISMGADFVATGHYAQEEKLPFSHGSHTILKTADRALVANAEENTTSLLLKSADPSKDQSYFLWTLKQEQLSKILFPVGHLKKTEVRKLAEEFNLPVATKKDSQGICFLGMVDLKNFLKHYIKEKKGNVLNTEGKIIGHHNGAVFYTLGERHGFTITEKGIQDGRYYVVEKDIKKNILVVSQDRALVTNTKKSTSFCLNIENVNWINNIPEENKTYTAQIRYHGEFLSCKIICQSKALAEIIFDKPILVASGQSVVVYDGDICLGGGIVI
jgi:tRNA-uridine 2-sulfurtransferase